MQPDPRWSKQNISSAEYNSKQFCVDSSCPVDPKASAFPSQKLENLKFNLGGSPAGDDLVYSQNLGFYILKKTKTRFLYPPLVMGLL